MKTIKSAWGKDGICSELFNPVSQMRDWLYDTDIRVKGDWSFDFPKEIDLYNLREVLYREWDYKQIEGNDLIPPIPQQDIVILLPERRKAAISEQEMAFFSAMSYG